jgi:hypothetical protein
MGISHPHQKAAADGSLEGTAGLAGDHPARTPKGRPRIDGRPVENTWRAHLANARDTEGTRKIPPRAGCCGTGLRKLFTTK